VVVYQVVKMKRDQESTSFRDSFALLGMTKFLFFQKNYKNFVKLF